ncbi:hypothetical protein [Streptomyces wuyuanensis]|uniref:Uncharacterized protein n=1 Tax=Streptomyces wuyuanensis TaxID=1196353 RepID=A0A1G9WAN2_9ACTN|nr:hypothetical protein SAMN05444921_113224 [Streptomyces wuyuanensis]
MGEARRVRRLVVDGTVWFWSLRHSHRDGMCRDSLSLTREGTSARLSIVFRAGDGRIVSGGAYWSGGSVGAVAGGDMNLHEPGAVRKLLDAALAAGVRAPAEIDGWPLFDALVGHGAPAGGAERTGAGGVGTGSPGPDDPSAGREPADGPLRAGADSGPESRERGSGSPGPASGGGRAGRSTSSRLPKTVSRAPRRDTKASVR